MHIADGEKYFRDVEHGDVIAEPTILPESIEEFSS